MKELIVFNKTKGIHSTVDPRQIKYNQENGFDYLTFLLNMNVTNEGAVQTREGYVIADDTVGYHSLYYWKRFLYCFSDGALYSISKGGNKVGLRSGLLDIPIYYQGIDDYIFYSNGKQNGYILNGVSHAWAPDDYVGPDTTREIQAVPPGKYLTWFKGAIFFAKDNYLFHTEQLQYTGMNLTSNFITFEDEIKMVLALDAVLIVATEKEIFTLQGDTPKEFVWKTILVDAVIENTGLVTVSPIILDSYLTGKVAIFTTQNGIYAVTEDNQLLDVTKDRLSFQYSLTGNAYMKDNFYTVFIDE